MMFKRNTKSPSKPFETEESHPRNSRVHRQSSIPSINLLRGLSGVAGVSNETNTPPPAGRLKTGFYHLPRVEPNPHQKSTPISYRRVASMPQQLPSNAGVQAQIDVDGDRSPMGLPSSPPTVDFTHGSRNGNSEGPVTTKMKERKRNSVSIKPILKRHSSAAVKTTTDINPHPASMRKPDPRLIISALEPLVAVDSPLKKPADVLDVYDLLGMHQLDQLDFEERDIARTNKSQARSSRGEMVVLGEPLRKTSIYASMTMVLGGREHDLPIIVVSCIEELYRTGIYQSNLFRTLPNRSRLLQLINIFDSEQQPPGSIIRSKQSLPPKNPVKSGFGADTSLHLESTPDICALLSTYLSALPEPILLPALFRPIWDWCGLEEDEVDALQLKPFRRRISSVPLSRTYTNPTESSRISVAQLVLHLLPSPHFSLLVYILAFFSQVAMVHEENGVGIEDLARMFGGRIFGGGQSRRRKLSVDIAMADPHEPRMEGEVMMCWFLRRWGPISEGLFDVIEDVKTGVLRDSHRALEKRCSVSVVPLEDAVGNGEVADHSSGRVTPFRPSPRDDISRFSGESPQSRPLNFHPPLRDEGSLNIKLHPKASKNNSYNELDRGDAPPAGMSSLGDETFTIPADNADEESGYFGTTHERLLDISMPTLLDQTFPIESFNDEVDDDPGSARIPTNMAKRDDELDKALRRILVLEVELEKSNKAVSELRQALSKEKLRCLDLERRIEEMAKVCESDFKLDDGYKRMLAIATKDRDDALDLVREIRKLMVKN